MYTIKSNKHSTFNLKHLFCKCLLTLNVLQVTSQCGHNSLINGSPLESNKLFSFFRGCKENKLNFYNYIINVC